jgi:hypothetical protein
MGLGNPSRGPRLLPVARLCRQADTRCRAKRSNAMRHSVATPWSERLLVGGLVWLCSNGKVSAGQAEHRSDNVGATVDRRLYRGRRTRRFSPCSSALTPWRYRPRPCWPGTVTKAAPVNLCAPTSAEAPRWGRLGTRLPRYDNDDDDDQTETSSSAPTETPPQSVPRCLLLAYCLPVLPDHLLPRTRQRRYGR